VRINFGIFTFITGDKKLCPNMMERLDLFNDSSNKNGSKIKVLLEILLNNRNDFKKKKKKKRNIYNK